MEKVKTDESRVVRSFLQFPETREKSSSRPNRIVQIKANTSDYALSKLKIAKGLLRIDQCQIKRVSPRIGFAGGRVIAAAVMTPMTRTLRRRIFVIGMATVSMMVPMVVSPMAPGRIGRLLIGRRRVGVVSLNRSRSLIDRIGHGL